MENFVQGQLFLVFSGDILSTFPKSVCNQVCMPGCARQGQNGKQ
jgi:hypothetical protein